MSPPKLNKEEALFVEAVEDGSPMDFPADPTLSDNQRRKAIIRADVLARIILGKEVEFPDGMWRSVKPTSAGFRLSGARIAGDKHLAPDSDVVLEDACGPNGAPLPRLSLEDCWFDGNIRLMRSRFQSLSFQKSRFRMLNASDANIDGPIDLGEVQGIGRQSGKAGFETYGQCWVLLASAAIAGRLTTAGARFQAPPKRDECEYVNLSRHARYALDLRAAHVQASLVLRPHCVAIGGVCVTLATIDGSIWANGAKFVAIEDASFAADYANIRGSVYLRPYDFHDRPKVSGSQEPLKNEPMKPAQGKSHKFISEGLVSLFAAKLGGSLYMQGATLKKTADAREKDSKYPHRVLNACNAEIGGDSYFSCWQSEASDREIHHFYSDGELQLMSARIKNDLSFNGAKVRNVVANNIEVGGNCSFSVRSESIPREGKPERASFQFRCGEVDIQGALIKGDLDMRGAVIGSEQEPAKVQASGVSVGGNCNLGPYTFDADDPNTQMTGLQFECNGAIQLVSARIRSDLSLNGARVRNVLANNIEVGGNCSFSAITESVPKRVSFQFRCGDVDIQGASIKGNLDMRGAVIGSKSTLAKVNASGISVGGNCYLGAYTQIFDPDDLTKKQVCGLEFECYGNVRLGESKIVNSLRMDGAKLTGSLDRKATLDLSGTTIGGDACLMTWDESDANTSLPFVAKGGSLVLKLAGVKIAQKLVLNGANITAKLEPEAGEISRAAEVSAKGTHNAAANPPAQESTPRQVLNKPSTTVYALNAANAEIGGKASLSTFLGTEGKDEKAFRFCADGEVNFTAATIKLGLDLSGATLKAARNPSAVASGSAGRVQAQKTKPPLALDLSRAHVKFLLMKKDGFSGDLGAAFDATGEINLEHVEVDAEMDLSGAKLRGQLNAKYAKVGTSVKLNNLMIARTSTEELIRKQPFQGEANSEIGRGFHEYSKASLVAAHVERLLKPDISFEAAEIGGVLEVDKVELLDMPASMERSYFKPLNHGTIDLRALHIGELSDNGGNAWGTDVRFWLESFRYDRLPEVARVKRQPPSPSGNWISFRRFWNPSSLSVPKGRDDQLESREVWERRLRWLDLQYFDSGNPTKREYLPDAYEQLVNGFNATGSYEHAWRIASARLTLEYKLRYPLLPTWWIGFPPIWWLLWCLLWRGLWFAFRVLFDYGFSIGRAFITFVFFVVLGTSVAYVADYGFPKFVPWFPDAGKVLIVNTSMPETRIAKVPGKEDLQVAALEPEGGLNTTTNNVPCEGRIRPLLYALDVFVPVLDLRQQDVCSIAPEHKWWRHLQAVYAILGWVLTPLTILTFTGFLRKHLEK